MSNSKVRGKKYLVIDFRTLFFLFPNFFVFFILHKEGRFYMEIKESGLNRFRFSWDSEHILSGGVSASDTFTGTLSDPILKQVAR